MTDYAVLSTNPFEPPILLTTSLEQAQLFQAHHPGSTIVTHEPVSEQYDYVGALMAFEDGELDEPEFIKLFQYLIDSGLAWSLQGRYGRTATHLIEEGLCTRPEEPERPNLAIGEEAARRARREFGIE